MTSVKGQTLWPTLHTRQRRAAYRRTRGVMVHRGQRALVLRHQADVIVRMVVANPLTPTKSARSPRAVVDDCFMPLKALSKYSGLSLRTLRTHLSHAIRPLPHYRPGGKILVKRSEFDEWIACFKATEFSKGSAIVAELLTDL